MAQEVRSILFTTEELHSAVVELLMPRIKGVTQRQIDRVEVQVRDGHVRASVSFGRGMNANRVLDPNELMAAILLHCRKARIPLCNRASKRLGVIDGCLSLTTSLNLKKIAPWVHGNTIVHEVAHQGLVEPGR